MALLTPLDADELRRLGALYGIRVVSTRGVLGGSVNTNHELTSDQGERFFLRLYEEQDEAGASRETALVHTLASRGVPTPSPRPLAGGHGFVARSGSKPVAVGPFVPGEHLCQARIAPAHTAALGRALGRVHQVGLALNEDERARLTAPSRFDPSALRARLEKVLAGPAPAEVQRDAARLDAELAGVVPGTARELPVVHGDLFRDNVLFDEHGELVALLDFESASRGAAAFDLAVTVLAWSFGDALDEGLARAFFRGYGAVRTLLPDERDDLFGALRLACLRFATTRITDYELRPRGVGVYKDYRRWLARLAAVDALGPAGAASLVGG